jgi:hypothetical protein
LVSVKGDDVLKMGFETFFVVGAMSRVNLPSEAGQGKSQKKIALMQHDYLAIPG